jgi:AAA domain, putative AbiEii toxin, Type IV TA system
MPLRVSLQTLVFSDGTELPVPDEGVVILVGPNNAGKSKALRDVSDKIAHPQALPGQVVSDIRFLIEGTDEEFETWLTQHAASIRRADGVVVYRRLNWGLHEMQVARGDWTAYRAGHMPTTTALFQLFCLHATAEARLGLAGGDVPQFDPVNDGPSNPLQVLSVDDTLSERISIACEEAFDEPLTLRRVLGAPLALHVGRPAAEPSFLPQDPYLAEILSLPRLDEQGDGMKSFIGLMLAIITSHYPIMLVDEPEAFLHPPQARLLGRRLTREPVEGTQLVVATHSVSILQGLLDDPTRPVTVARIVRDGAVNRVSVLSQENLRELWEDPLLRYSSVLDGLFHRGVVVSESDSDSRFYAAVLDATREEGERIPDLLFTQAGGKQRLPTVIKALRAVEVPVAAIADFDVLREEGDMRRIVDALGGDWVEIQPLWRPLKSALDGLGAAPGVLVVAEEITEILKVESGSLTGPVADKVRATLRLNSGWDAAKRAGLSALPQGQVSKTGEELLNKLAEIRFFVVPVGEVERWVPAVDSHGPKWVSAVLEEKRHTDGAGGAANFMEKVAASIL